MGLITALGSCNDAGLGGKGARHRESDEEVGGKKYHIGDSKDARAKTKERMREDKAKENKYASIYFRSIFGRVRLAVSLIVHFTYL